MDYVSNSLWVRFIRKMLAIVICFQSRSFPLFPSFFVSFHMQECFVKKKIVTKTDNHSVHGHLLRHPIQRICICVYVVLCSAVLCLASCVCTLLLMCNRRVKAMTQFSYNISTSCVSLRFIFRSIRYQMRVSIGWIRTSIESTFFLDFTNTKQAQNGWKLAHFD